MAKSFATFDFYGVAVQVECDETGVRVLESLKEDFVYFLMVDDDLPCGLVFRLTGAPQKSTAPSSTGLYLFSNKMAHVYGWGRARYCDFSRGGKPGDAVRSIERHGVRVFEIGLSSFDALYEVTYTAILSAVGEELDRRGIHRAHGLGIEVRGLSLLALLESGSGKSALASLFLDSPDARFYSDETPLLKGDRVFPFPLRRALAPAVASALGISHEGARLFRRRFFPAKLLLPLPQDRIASPRKLDVLLIGRKAGGPASIGPVSKWRARAVLALQFVVGLGIAQMAEHMLRPRFVFRLLGIAVSRFKTALKLIASCEVLEFRVSPDARENASVLKKFISSRRPESESPFRLPGEEFRDRSYLQ